MKWTALVPLKAAGARKTRLSPALSATERDRLAEAMFGHVAAALKHCTTIVRTVVLAEAPPPAWDGDWVRDGGGGLNAELAAAARLLAGPVLAIHADLPELAKEDVRALLAAAGDGGAIAPDRWGHGTNALALPRGSSAFHFGPESFVRHRAMLPEGTIVRRRGLERGVDLPEDLDLIRGFR